MLQLQNSVVIPKQVNKQMEKRFFLIPSLFVGVGGFSKPILPRLDSLFQEHYGFRPDALPMTIFDVDEANAEVSLNGRKVSIRPYLVHLSKKIIEDIAKLRRRKHKESIPFLEIFKEYVDFENLRYVEAPGWNMQVQNANLGWRLLWQSHVLPTLTAKIRNLHPEPRTINKLEGQGFKVSNRSVIWVVAGGASTTGPTGLIPLLAELKQIKPPETSLFALVFSPNSYRDKSESHRTRGRAIFRATMEQLFKIFNGKEFCQPYGTDGYRISLFEEPFDQLFLVDGSLSGGRTELKVDEMADVVSRFLFRFTVGPVGEHLLGVIGNLNDGLKGENNEGF